MIIDDLLKETVREIKGECISNSVTEACLMALCVSTGNEPKELPDYLINQWFGTVQAMLTSKADDDDIIGLSYLLGQRFSEGKTFDVAQTFARTYARLGQRRKDEK